MATTAQTGLGAVLGALVAVVPAMAAPMEVDLELVLAVDVSSSMDESEQRVEREGYMRAFTDPSFLRAVEAGSFGRVAVTYVEWAGPDEQDVLMPWTVLATEADALAITRKLAAVPLQRRTGGTSISGALVFAAGLFENNGFAGRRRVIDLSGDGYNNIGAPVLWARDQVVARDITINGLAVTLDGGTPSRSPLPGLADYFDHCVIGGAGAFVVPVGSALDLVEAIRLKLVLDVAGLAPGGDASVHRVAATSVDCLVGEAKARGMFGRP